MASITTWTRLEPRARSGDLRPATEAQLHDPLWSLGRQWQFGEFLGDDAGSPVWVRVRGTASTVTAFRAGSAPREDYDPDVPLEAVAEREQTHRTDLRAAAESGQRLSRVLTAAGLPAVAAAVLREFPMPAPGPHEPESARRYLAVLAGRAVHGDAFAAESLHLVPAGTLPPRLGLDPTATAAAVPVVEEWLAWHYGRRLHGPESWDPTRLEHRFTVAARVDGAEVALRAPEYPGGRLDWPDFTAAGADGLAPAARQEKVVSTTFAAPASFPGMPARRYWEFEDARTTIGGVEAAPEDLARMLLAEFATVYSSDWYAVPLDVPVGSLTRLTSVVVADTFSSVLGGPTLAPLPGTGKGDAHWSLFTLSTTSGGRLRALFLPPSTGRGLDGEPVEEVLFARDEDANQAWAVEKKVTDAIGGALDRTGEPFTPHVPGATEAGALRYRLATAVPVNWIPMLPVETRPGAVVLRRAHLVRHHPDGTQEEVAPLGELLSATHDVREEEIPREGAQVTRATQYTRGADGRHHLWTGRRKRPGTGESASGLRFDSLLD
ncbi:hypothetical protein UO65_4876 [Actinokineospora spheciospongiae]|uniref:Uncharacterized protein n=1 Tax=Actinokineospora spheciospongiae TaxID=909613 RepID=W7IHQ6_9PSEU|nr:hypothetical protein [Actinokineospora spheciospongiae]EWC59873.1 hypothetical protein UO65_4876 [Actinokineospora spheciospongiae]